MTVAGAKLLVMTADAACARTEPLKLMPNKSAAALKRRVSDFIFVRSNGLHSSIDGRFNARNLCLSPLETVVASGSVHAMEH